MKGVKLIGTFVFSFLFVVSVFGQDKKAAKTFTYVGVKTCKMCHSSTKSGAAYKIWLKGKHSKAYTELASDEAKAIAKKKGIADPQKADECLACHVTGFGVDAKLKGPKLTMEEGVSCEACHGPGSAYKSKKVMVGLYMDEIDPKTVGLIEPTKEVCVQCHNKKSPTYKEFVYEKMVKEIAHPVPKAAK